MKFSHLAVECIGSLLTKRLQQNTVRGVVSDRKGLKQGVPQGTVLGTLLFNLYVDDLSNQFSENVQIIQYAYDCLLFCSDNERRLHLTADRRLL